MKKLSFLAAGLLAACSQTQNQGYYEIKQSYDAAQKLAISYKDKCTPKPATDGCHAVVAKLRSADETVVDAIKRADPILSDGDAKKSELELAALQLAFAKFNNLVITEAK